jgi:hypothetical protein
MSVFKFIATPLSASPAGTFVLLTVPKLCCADASTDTHIATAAKHSAIRCLTVAPFADEPSHAAVTQVI